MLTQLRNYLGNLSSNLVSFSKAAVKSSTLLFSSPAVGKIIKPLMTISFEDFLPAAGAYFLNNSLQRSYNEYREFQDELAVLDIALIVTVTTANIVLTGFMLNRMSHGSVRSIALTKAIPLLLNEEQQEAPPLLQIDNRDTFVLNTKRIQQVIYFLPKNFIYVSIANMLPNHYFIQYLLRLGVGYQVVNNALDEKTLTRLNSLKINSLPLLVGGVYLLGSVLKNPVLQSVNNPYLDLMVDHAIYVGLLTIVANLKLESLPIHSELYSPNPSSLVEYLPVDRMFRQGCKVIKGMPFEQLGETKAVLAPYFQMFISLGLWPEMLHSPEKLLDDRVIKHLLESLSESNKAYLLNKYSKKQIETLLGHLEIMFTKQAPRHTSAISKLLEVDRWVGALENKMVSNQYSQADLLIKYGLFEVVVVVDDNVDLDSTVSSGIRL